MLKVSVEKATELLKIADNHGINICLVGQIGVGKTELIEKYAKDNGKTLHTLILSALDPSETLGVPSKEYTEIDGKRYPILETVLPGWALRAANEPKPLIFIDELLTAPPEVSNTFLNFLTTKKVGPLDLSHAQIVFATNVERDTIGYNIPSNFMNRLCFFELGFFEEKFKDYMGKLGPVVLSMDIITKNNDLGNGSRLYDPRELSPRNFKKLNEVAHLLGTQTAIEFAEGYTNLKLIASQIQIFRIEMTPLLKAHLEDLGMKSKRLHDSIIRMLESTVRSIQYEGQGIPENISERLSASFFSVTDKSLGLDLTEVLVDMVKVHVWAQA